MIRAMGDHVFIRKESLERVSAGGIILRAQEYDEGVVVAVGPGKIGKKGARESMWGIHPGQRVAFSPQGNHRQKVNGEEVVVVRRDSIIGEVNDEP